MITHANRNQVVEVIQPLPLAALVEYEIMGSPWPSLIGGFTPDLMARYFIWKTKRKHRRYLWMFEHGQRRLLTPSS